MFFIFFWKSISLDIWVFHTFLVFVLLLSWFPNTKKLFFFLIFPFRIRHSFPLTFIIILFILCNRCSTQENSISTERSSIVRFEIKLDDMTTDMHLNDGNVFVRSKYIEPVNLFQVGALIVKTIHFKSRFKLPTFTPKSKKEKKIRNVNNISTLCWLNNKNKNVFLNIFIEQDRIIRW